MGWGRSELSQDPTLINCRRKSRIGGEGGIRSNLDMNLGGGWIAMVANNPLDGLFWEGAFSRLLRFPKGAIAFGNGPRLPNLHRTLYPFANPQQLPATMTGRAMNARGDGEKAGVKTTLVNRGGQAAPQRRGLSPKETNLQTRGNTGAKEGRKKSGQGKEKKNKSGGKRRKKNISETNEKQTSKQNGVDHGDAADGRTGSLGSFPRAWRRVVPKKGWWAGGALPVGT